MHGTCSARASVLNASFSHGLGGQTGDVTDPKLSGYMHHTLPWCPCGVPFHWAAGSTRQRQKTFLTWGPPV